MKTFIHHFSPCTTLDKNALLPINYCRNPKNKVEHRGEAVFCETTAKIAPKYVKKII